MNTNKLKKFAQETRRKLLKQVNGKLEHVLTAETGDLREKAHIIKDLKKDLDRMGREALVDKVAYTWFNRFVALRYMDVRGFQPLEVSVLTPKEGQVSPEILQEAMAGHIPDDLKVDRQKIMDLLDGRIQSSNAENEAFRLLLVGVCNHLHDIFPFLFERIDDYSELLLPDDLTSEFSIVQDVIDGMVDEDCQEVEVLGWLYQFYISEKNNELISSKKSYKKDELAPASQLFTPDWIVRYMVDNTLGQLWTEVNPSTSIHKDLEFYIEPSYRDQLSERENKGVEEITFFEPCVGSGHILSYAFDVFYKMYEEQGYNPSEIPELIITKNLYGVDIDQRATQIASFVLMMKGREKYRRFFRKEVVPNIFYYEDYENDDLFKNATALGSLIKVAPEQHNKVEVSSDSLFGHQQQKLKELYKLLGRKYDVVVTNPPYISSSRMEVSLKKYVDRVYENVNADLFSVFVIRCLELSKSDGLTGYMTPFVWMFISSYQELRETIIDDHSINNLVQLEYGGFSGATVPVCTFTLRNKHLKGGKASFIRLSDFVGPKNQAPKTIEAINNPNCGWFYQKDPSEFHRVPDSSIGAYWLSDESIKAFDNGFRFEEEYTIRQGMATGDNARFIRYWYEVQSSLANYQAKNKKDAWESNKKWFPMDKGGGFRKWYGLKQSVVSFDRSSYEILKKMGNKCPSEDLYFYNGLTWGKITSGSFSVRYSPTGNIFSDAGMKIIFSDSEPNLTILGFLNSKSCPVYLSCFSETLNFEKGNIAKLPILINRDKEVEDLVSSAKKISKLDWDAKEFSWDFHQNELIRFKKEGGIETLEEAYDHFKQYWENKFYQLHQNEEELNRQFIEIYGLQEELTPDVPLNEITILQEELDSKKLKKIEKEWRGNSKSQITNSKPDLPFKDKEVMAQFMSYAVGCMFGRYSLNKEGLILANQGETLEDYLQKVSLSENEVTFLPDDDNIIPVLDDEWFEDDIVARFHEFLKASFGAFNFQKNLQFVEEMLGHDVRKYFDKYFYKDHYKRYNKRPIYWKFSSPKGSFNVLIYMHRYTPDTLNNILNNYLREFINKLRTQKEQMQHLENTGSASEKARASKEIDKINTMIKDCEEYEREILYPLASERIEMDLDDGVLVNYNLFGKAVEEIKSVNDNKKKKKVKEFDWIDGSRVR